MCVCVCVRLVLYHSLHDADVLCYVAQSTQAIATRKVQELSAELASHRQTSAQMRDALQVAQSTLDTQNAPKQLHDVSVLRAQMEVGSATFNIALFHSSVVGGVA